MIKTKKCSDGSLFVYDENVEVKIGGVEDSLIAESKKYKKWGVISPIILSKDNKILWHGCFIAPNLCMPMSYAAGEEYIGQYPGTREVSVVPFLCALISKECLAKCGQPDDLGKNIFNDSNYCLHVLANEFKILATDVESVRYLGNEFNEKEYRQYATELGNDSVSFQQKWADTLRKFYKYPVCYHTKACAPTGFAVAVTNYMTSLSELGIDVQYSYINGVPEAEEEPNSMYLTALLEKQPDMDCPQVIWGQAPLFFKNSGKYKIGHCEFEGEDWPQIWVKYCNMMDEVWVPTKWDRAKAIKAGVNKPIYIIYQGIDKEYYHPKIAPMKIDVKQSFKFICTAAWDPRKNLPNLIKTFSRTFKKEEDVCLIIKTMNVGLVGDIQEELKKLNIPEDSAWIYVKEEDWPPTHLPCFYNAGNCFVLPTHGEGWGLPIFEALACGVPVITTRYGVPNEVLIDPDNPKKPLPGLHLLDYNVVGADSNYTYLIGNQWAEPNLEQLAQEMRYVYDHYKQEKEKAMKTSEYIRKTFDWHECVKPIIERLEAIYKKGF